MRRRHGHSHSKVCAVLAFPHRTQEYQFVVAAPLSEIAGLLALRAGEVDEILGFPKGDAIWSGSEGAVTAAPSLPDYRRPARPPKPVPPPVPGV
jgi:hypothetical protein